MTSFSEGLQSCSSVATSGDRVRSDDHPASRWGQAPDMCSAGLWDIQPDAMCPVCGALPDTKCDQGSHSMTPLVAQDAQAQGGVAGSPLALNATDLIILRRLIAAVGRATRFSDSDLADAKLCAGVLGERFGADVVRPVLAEVA